MKKSISVNIKGAIFNIEEDAFDILKKYLDTIKKYFSNYEDSSEIYDDIESRVAELLHEKLNEDKKIITNDDVNQVTSAMGMPEDFAEQEDEFHTNEESNNESQEEKFTTSSVKQKRFYKDGKRKIVSGVCAGIAHYFSIDPFWIRLLMVLSPFVTFGTALIAYIILALILPTSNDLEDNSVKKLYRDGEEAVLGGVSAGVAKFLGTDPVIIRVIFVVGFFAGGVGIITYCLLWLIIPEAKSRSEKMQMDGDPITISNIEKNIKENLNLKDSDGEESTLATILLFPFRIIAQIFNGLSKLFKPLSEFVLQFIRFVGGFGFLAVGLSMMFAFFMLLAVGLGMISGDNVSINSDIPIGMFSSEIPLFGIISGFFTGFLPSLLFILLGITLFMKRSFVKPIVIGAIFGFWIISIGITAGSALFIAKDFKEDSKFTKNEIFNIDSNELLIELNENHSIWQNVDLIIKTTSDSSYKLVQVYESRGANNANAKDNAKKIIYKYQIEGNKLILDESITFNDDYSFRAQNVTLKLYVPFNQKIRINEEVRRMLKTRSINSYPSIDSHESSTDIDLTERIWISKKKGLRCINCEDITGKEDVFKVNKENEDSEPDNSISFDFENFNKVKVSDAFDVKIVQGDIFKVRAFGNEDDLNEVKISTDDEWLIINYVGENVDIDLMDFKNNSRKIKILIEAPIIDELDISGATIVDLRINNQSRLNIDLSGASELDLIAGKIDNCSIDISGASQSDLEGECSVLTIDLSGASQLDARDLISEIVIIEASGASTAKVNAKGKLEAEASGLSTIKYKGNPELEIDEDGLSKIKKD